MDNVFNAALPDERRDVQWTIKSLFEYPDYNDDIRLYLSQIALDLTETKSVELNEKIAPKR